MIKYLALFFIKQASIVIPINGIACNGFITISGGILQK